MNNNVKIVFTFTLGVVVGAAATWQFFKTKYEAISQEEINSVKEVYSKRNKKEDANKTEKETDISQDDEVNNYKNIITVNNYTNNKKEGGSESMEENKIEVIPPDEFGENDEYDIISLTLYEDGILADDGDFIIEDVENTVGTEALDSFGEWEEDAVYVRNDERKCYYEILKDIDNYSGPSVMMDADE